MTYRQRTRPERSLAREEPSSPYGAPDPFEFEAEEDPDDRRYQEFLNYLAALDSEPKSTLSRQLISDGITLPPPEIFSEESVHGKLWEVIKGLARRRHFLEGTDHLSDLELYRHLWEITLNEPRHALDASMGDCAGHLNLISDGSPESIWLWLRYYADEQTRQNWAHDFPGEKIPKPAPRPFDRDRHLPSYWSP